MILNKLTKFRSSYFIALLFATIGFTSCEDNAPAEVVLFDIGTMNPVASSIAIKAKETVDFSSNATKVQSITWSFPGGTPSTSTSEKVTVQYKSGGIFVATLKVKYIDNTTEQKTISITVEAPPIPVLPPITGLGIYTERVVSATNIGKTPVNNGNMIINEVDADTNHGSKSLLYKLDPTGNGNLQSGFALSLMDLTVSPFDASSYAFFNISVKSSTPKSVRVRLNTNSGNYWVVLTPATPLYGMLWDGAWHNLKIPFTDFKKDGNGATLAATAAAKSSFKQFAMRTDDTDYVSTANSWIYYIDDIYLTAN